MRQAIHQVTYNNSGNNARVNNHSTDNSVNHGDVGKRRVQSYPGEHCETKFQNAPLTADKKAEAVELIDEVETHCIRETKRVS